MTPIQRLVARVLALGGALFAVSLLERVAAAAEADAAAARLAAHTADAALFAHLTGGECTCRDVDPEAVAEIIVRNIAEDQAAKRGGGESPC